MLVNALWTIEFIFRFLPPQQYGFFLFVLIVAQIVIAALVFIYVGDVREALIKGFSRLFDEREKPANREVIDAIQANVSFNEHLEINPRFLISIRPFQLQCCGKSSALDWLGTIPDSCCNPSTAPVCIPYLTGCKSRLGELIDKSGEVLGWVSLGVAAVELFGLIASCCLANGIRNESRRSAYH